MNNIKKDGNTLLPTGYNQWRKDIEQLIDTAKLKTAISVNQVFYVFTPLIIASRQQCIAVFCYIVHIIIPFLH